jgi:xyloglucan-specific exo-beta-1,4-glucanase
MYGFLPHKGIFSPAEKTLYISYSNGAGPYDGTNGTVHKYNISSGVWTNISPTSMSSTYYGYGGLAVDLQVPGTVMVAALNCWWPDEIIWRSLDSGTTWSPIWDWNGYPDINYYYDYDISNAPWLQDDTSTAEFPVRVGWMVEALAIDPFDSNHWLYGTGETIYGGHDLLKWDSIHNVTLQTLTAGVEEMDVLGLIAPPGGPQLLSVVGDDGGFYHTDLNTAPQQAFHDPTYGSTNGIDYAGNNPAYVVRAGSSSTLPTISLSTDFGLTWSADYAASSSTVPGSIALSADGDTVLLMPTSGSPLVSTYSSTFNIVSSLPSGAVIASDKSNNTVFYGGSTGSFYVSINSGASFTKTVSLGSSTAVNAIRAHPSIAGDIWVTTDTGLWHSTNYGSSFSQIGSGCTAGWSFGFGKPSTTASYPVLFGFFTVDGVTALFKTEDEGTNWEMISNASHGFGAASANVVNGDLNNYGRVFVGTNGRGIWYGVPSGSLPTSTGTSTPTSISSTAHSSSTTSTPTTLRTTLSSKPLSSSSTTAITSSKSSTTTTVTSPTSTATASPYAQCGGSGYTGPTACPTGWTCTVENSYYSQCK